MSHEKKKDLSKMESPPRRQGFHDFEVLLSSHKVHAESKRVLIGFTDIIGFAAWTRRAINDPEDKKFVLTRLYKFLSYLRTKGYFVKSTGDGGMIVTELAHGHNCGRAAEFLRAMDDFVFYMNEVIKRVDPRPGFMRARVSTGRVISLSMNSCLKRGANGCSFLRDYVEYPVILASRILDVDKEKHLLICTDMVKSIIGKKAEKEGIVFSDVEVSERRLDGIDVEDLKSLKSFEVLD